MWGGSYAGYDQWATAQKFPPHLATIVPVSSVVPGVDFPVRNNTFPPYDIQGCTMTLHLVRSTITGATWRKLHRQRARHFLVIGPWDHPGTRTPKQEFMGMTFGAASLVDLPKLHLDWYRFTMEGGSKPEFLQKQVAYYVSGAEHWRYADALEAITQSQDLP
jgi:hypothetical protein